VLLKTIAIKLQGLTGEQGLAAFAAIGGIGKSVSRDAINRNTVRADYMG